MLVVVMIENIRNHLGGILQARAIGATIFIHCIYVIIRLDSKLKRGL
jgi:hypothetical protein